MPIDGHPVGTLPVDPRPVGTLPVGALPVGTLPVGTFPSPELRVDDGDAFVHRELGEGAGGGVRGGVRRVLDLVSRPSLGVLRRANLPPRRA